MSNEIDLYSRFESPLPAIAELGKMFANSGMFGCSKTEQGQVLAMICLAERKSPVQILRDYHIIDGKLSKKALASLADFRARGGKHKWINTGDDGIEAVLELSFEGQQITSRFTIEQAKAQGLVRPNSNWVKTPGNMLRARAISNGVAMLCPEIYAGADDESETPIVEVAPLLVAKPEPKPAKVEEIKPANIVNLPAAAHPATSPAPATETESVASVAHAAEGSTQAQTLAQGNQLNPQPASDSRKFAVTDVKGDPTTGKLTPETVFALQLTIGDSNAEAALKWLINSGWVKKNLDELSVERARRIVEKPQAFINLVNKPAK